MEVWKTGDPSVYFVAEWVYILCTKKIVFRKTTFEYIVLNLKYKCNLNGAAKRYYYKSNKVYQVYVKEHNAQGIRKYGVSPLLLVLTDRLS